MRTNEVIDTISFNKSLVWQLKLVVFYHLGYEKIVELLLDNGASYINENSTDGTIHTDAQNGNNYICISMAIWRCERRCLNTYPCFLVSGGAEMIDLMSQNKTNIMAKIKEADKLLLHAAEQGKIQKHLIFFDTNEVLIHFGHPMISNLFRSRKICWTSAAEWSQC